MCVQCGSPSVRGVKGSPLLPLHPPCKWALYTALNNTQHTTRHSPHRPPTYSLCPLYCHAIFSVYFRSVQITSFLYPSHVFVFLYLLVFLSVLYLAEQGSNLHSLWPLWERDGKKERGKFLWSSWWYWRLHPHLSHHLSLLQTLNTSQIGNRRRKQYRCQLSLSVCHPLHMIMLLQAEMFFSLHLSNNWPMSHFLCSSLHFGCF